MHPHSAPANILVLFGIILYFLFAFNSRWIIINDINFITLVNPLVFQLSVWIVENQFDPITTIHNKRGDTIVLRNCYGITTANIFIASLGKTNLHKNQKGQSKP